MRWAWTWTVSVLGALILALGLLVDDAISRGRDEAVKLEQGYDRLEAATFAWTSTAFQCYRVL